MLWDATPLQAVVVVVDCGVSLASTVYMGQWVEWNGIARDGCDWTAADKTKYSLFRRLFSDGEEEAGSQITLVLFISSAHSKP